MIALSCGITISAVRHLVLPQSTRVIDRRTDRQTDRITTPKTALAYARAVKKQNEEYLYGAIIADAPLTKRSDMDHTVLPANYTMSSVLAKQHAVSVVSVRVAVRLCVCLCVSVSWS